MVAIFPQAAASFDGYSFSFKHRAKRAANSKLSVKKDLH